jgi:hypothetical protein
MKIIVVKDDGEQIESETFLVAIHTEDKPGKDFIAVNGLTDVGILTVCMEILNQVQQDNNIPDPPHLCKDCDDKRHPTHEDEKCTCGLDFEKLIKENLNAKKN